MNISELLFILYENRKIEIIETQIEETTFSLFYNFGFSNSKTKKQGHCIKQVYLLRYKK